MTSEPVGDTGGAILSEGAAPSSGSALPGPPLGPPGGNGAGCAAAVGMPLSYRHLRVLRKEWHVAASASHSDRRTTLGSTHSSGNEGFIVFSVINGGL